MAGRPGAAALRAGAAPLRAGAARQRTRVARRISAAAILAALVATGPTLATVSAPREAPPATPAAPVAISLDTPGTNERASVADDESQLPGLEADQPAVTPDGRYVVFRAGVAGAGFADRNDRILLRDRTLGTTTELWSSAQVASGLRQAPLPILAEEPTIAADGNTVAFTLTAGRAGTPRVVLWRRGLGLSSPFADPNLPGEGFAGSSFASAATRHPKLSADGNVLVFEAEPSGERDVPIAGYYALVFATASSGALVQAVSARTGATDPYPGQADFGTAAVSADGNLVAFSSSQDFDYQPILSDYPSGAVLYSNPFVGFYEGPVPGVAYASPEPGSSDGIAVLTATYVPPQRQIWLRNRLTRTTTLVSAALPVPGAYGDAKGSGNSDHPAMSADGSVVAFESEAPDLVASDSDQVADIFARTGDGPTRRVSIPPAGGEANGPSDWPAVSADGRLIAFASQASNLVPGDTNGGSTATLAARLPASDIFLAGPAEDRLARESVGVGTVEANGSSNRPALAANGDLVVFDSLASNLVGDDTNGVTDVFVRVRLPPPPPPQRFPAITASPNPLDLGPIVIGDFTQPLHTIAVTSVGDAPLTISGTSVVGRDATDFVVAVDTCTGRTLPPGAGCSVGILFVVATAPARTATLLIANNSRVDPYPVPLLAERGEGPRLVLQPPSGPPGTVVIATGTGFPRNLPVTFTWSKGITPTPLNLTLTDARGRFRAQVLVLPNDVVGLRRLTADVGLPGFEAPSARFLVVRPTAIPPLITVQEFQDRDRVIVLRR